MALFRIAGSLLDVNEGGGDAAYEGMPIGALAVFTAATAAAFRWRSEGMLWAPDEERGRASYKCK